MAPEGLSYRSPAGPTGHGRARPALRVAIEAAPLALSSGGLQRYTSELSLALARCFPDEQFVLVSDQPFAMPECAPPNLRRGGGPRGFLERRWWLCGLPRELQRLEADLVHGPDFAVPYFCRKPSVLTLHDLSPWMVPHWHHAAHRVQRRTPVLLKLGLATMIVTPTASVRTAAIDRFGLHPSRVVAVPEAAPSWMRPAPDGQRPTTAPYFLFVGTLEPRKNLPLLIEAWREVRRRHPVDLAIAGRRRADFPPLAPEPGLHWLGEVPDHSLPALYSGALAFVYPSHYEGFGLPVLEAMQSGACVIASRAVAEAAGDAAVIASSGQELRQAMLQAVERPEWLAECRARSLRRAREFSWDRTARLTHEVYEEARRRFAV
jgi:glycosyltransferase involved in cell wall biosynthesis